MPAATFVIFFDIGDTLGIPVLSAGGKLLSVELFPFVREVLARLSAKCRLGAISNTRSESAETMQAVMTASGLAEFLDPALLLFSSVEGLDKSQPAFFDLACQRAGLPSSRCVFVGENDAERAVASSAGWKVSFHPLHVFHVIDRFA